TGIPAQSAGRPLPRALETRLSRVEAQIVDTLRSSGSVLSLDQALARYEDAIFEGLCELADVPPAVIRDAFAALAPAPKGSGQAQGGALATANGYFELQTEFRRTQLELGQLEAEMTRLARLRSVFPALAGERNGERKALRQALEEFVTR